MLKIHKLNLPYHDDDDDDEDEERSNKLHYVTSGQLFTNSTKSCDMCDMFIMPMSDSTKKN